MIRKRVAKSATPATVRKVNIAEVLQALWEHESLSRAEITSILGLSATTMAKLMDSLLQDKSIVEIPNSETLSKGRPSKHYKLNSEQLGLILVMIGIKTTLVVGCTPDGKELMDNEVLFDTSGNYKDFISNLKTAVKKVSADFTKSAKLVVGVSIPGMIREGEHLVENSPNLKFLNGHAPALDICTGTSFLPATIQEERALCLAQRSNEKFKNMTDIVAIDLSEGFGLGIISSNNVLAGSNGFAGELGHVSLDGAGPLCACGKKGCFEVLASDTALVREASRVMSRDLTFEEVAAYIAASDPTVLSVLKNVIEIIAKALAIAINIFNPQAVLLHARMFDIKSYDILAELQKQVKKDALSELVERCVIEKAPVRRRYGVARFSSEKLFEALIGNASSM